MVSRAAAYFLSAFMGFTIASNTDSANAAEVYPARPIRLIVPYQPGGSTDFASRTVQQGLSRTSGIQIVVDNRPGAGTALGTELAARSAPDGYTLLLSSTPFSILPTLRKKLPYNPAKDFTAITQIASQPYIVVVPQKSAITNIKTLISTAKAKPGTLIYGSAGTGSGAHLAVEALLMQTGLRMVHVPYKGGGPAVIALMGNELDVVLTTIISALPHQKSGKLRAIGVTSKKRMSIVPDVPTVSESGLDLYETTSWNGILTIARTPPAISARLNREIVAVLRNSDVRALFEKEGAEAVGSSGPEFETFIKEETSKWAKVIRFAQIQSE
jgi:tripartite-type tricarboxylate transporter receptor subunit TctC